MTLKNKLDASDEVELAHEEERMSKLAALALYRDGTLDTLVPGTFSALKTIHVALFGDIYDFVGRIRTVNLAKGNFRFASAIYLESAIRSIETMPQENFDQIVEKYVEMNIAHPFREGNGRSGRIWLDHMFRRELGRTVDWSRIGREDYLLAMERSPVRDLEIKALLGRALSDDLHSVALLARSVDASYAYEGYDAYRAEDLGSNGASGAAW
ncbi:cell filamentation protein Fic [Olsenella sp. AM30-3LB]|jgi:cell filamentation protein|uniref:protein adenylyltransferase Fic n=1 Tax=unclassified Olsenella TaxID=2638792 RepID=UPI000509DEF2|nr:MULTISPECIES: Fic family protein [unclassified Olsenella]RGJ46819.1 cell filamentation protein Fic [Olsenella sp. TM06-36]RHD73274.1 cell filamentation protein Fic [Olsenella sp. AM30-3LB]RHJ92770.1 cell filamentation protein Fic [Olsenella sp. AM05-7]RHJ97802.1 cell filamentation protein Fic [Olsenella sp. AM05-17]